MHVTLYFLAHSGMASALAMGSRGNATAIRADNLIVVTSTSSAGD
jgi:hypothetical protein